MLKQIVLVCVLALVPSASIAATAGRALNAGVGPRLGFSSSPDQFLVGGQLVIGEVAPNLTFDPSLEIGLGDDRTTVQFNLDLHYHFDTRTTWRPYIGGGATLANVNFDESRFGNRDSETGAGGGIVIGAGVPTATGSRFFTELKLGLAEELLPDLKLVAGWNFRM